MPLSSYADGYRTQLAAAHALGGLTFRLRSGDGARLAAGLAAAGFAAVDGTHPTRFTVALWATKDDYSDRSKVCTYTATSLVGDVLGGLTAVEGYSDRAFAPGDVLSSEWTAGAVLEIETIAATPGPAGPAGHSPALTWGTGAASDQVLVDSSNTGPHLTGLTGATGPAPSGSANLVLATPDGSSGTATLRAMVAADVPALPYDAAGAAAAVNSTLTAYESDVTTALAGKQAAGSYLTSLAGALLAANNLSDVTDPEAACDNLGVYTAGETDSLLAGKQAAGSYDTGGAAAAVNSALTAYEGTVTTALAAKAPFNSPTFTGTPTAPTQATSDNSTRLATTAYVKAQPVPVVPVSPVYYSFFGGF